MTTFQAPIVKQRKHHYLLALLLSSLLLLPAFSVQATTPAQPAAIKAVGAVNLTVTILTPAIHTAYFEGKIIKTNLSMNGSFVYGRITVVASVTGTNISKATLFVDGKEFANVTTISNGTVSFDWGAKDQSGLKLKHELKVVVSNTSGSNASASINVTKWRFHPLPVLVILGASMMPSLLPKTTIRGIVFNFHKRAFGYTCFAIKVHYKSTSLAKRQTGTIFMKRIHVGPSTSLRMFNLSPLKLTWISGSFLGMFK